MPAAASHNEPARRVPLSMSHIGLYVHDLPTMEDFYTRVLGFTVTDRGKVRGADIVFTSWDPKDHHQVALVSGRPKDLDRGYYVEPTVFANVDNSSTIAQEEIFGPVLTVIPADDEDHIVATANDTIYGLNASVFTHDVDRARQVSRQLRSGTVGHNAFRSDFSLAFGGFKQSGIGRELGEYALANYTEVKTVTIKL